jgi:hypothetical protein
MISSAKEPGSIAAEAYQQVKCTMATAYLQKKTEQ